MISSQMRQIYYLRNAQFLANGLGRMALESIKAQTNLRKSYSSWPCSYTVLHRIQRFGLGARRHSLHPACNNFEDFGASVARDLSVTENPSRRQAACDGISRKNCHGRLRVTEFSEKTVTPMPRDGKTFTQGAGALKSQFE